MVSSQPSSTDDTSPSSAPVDGLPRRRLRRILAAEEREPIEKIRSLLQVGVEALEVENGHLVEIDPAEGSHTVAVASASYAPIEVGVPTDLSTTYCRNVLAEGGPFSVEDAEAEGWAGDPAYETYGLSCYLGTKVLVEGELYGTVCFVARSARSTPFRDEATAFVEQVAQSIGQVLERRRQRAAVEREKRQLSRTEELLRRLQAAAPVGGWELDPEARHSFWTEEAQRIFELDVEDPELSTVLQQMGAEARAEIESALRRCVEEAEPFTIEVPTGAAVEESEWVELHGVPREESGNEETDTTLRAGRERICVKT